PPRRTRPSTLLGAASSQVRQPRVGLQPRYSGLRGQGTAGSPPSTANTDRTTSPDPVKRYRSLAIIALSLQLGDSPIQKRITSADTMLCPASSSGRRKGSRWTRSLDTSPPPCRHPRYSSTATARSTKRASSSTPQAKPAPSSSFFPRRG